MSQIKAALGTNSQALPEQSSQQDFQPKDTNPVDTNEGASQNDNQNTTEKQSPGSSNPNMAPDTYSSAQMAALKDALKTNPSSENSQGKPGPEAGSGGDSSQQISSAIGAPEQNLDISNPSSLTPAEMSNLHNALAPGSSSVGEQGPSLQGQQGGWGSSQDSPATSESGGATGGDLKEEQQISNPSSLSPAEMSNLHKALAPGSSPAGEQGSSLQGQQGGLGSSQDSPATSESGGTVGGSLKGEQQISASDNSSPTVPGADTGGKESGSPILSASGSNAQDNAAPTDPTGISGSSPSSNSSSSRASGSSITNESVAISDLSALAGSAVSSGDATAMSSITSEIPTWPGGTGDASASSGKHPQSSVGARGFTSVPGWREMVVSMMAVLMVF